MEREGIHIEEELKTLLCGSGQVGRSSGGNVAEERRKAMLGHIIINTRTIEGHQNAFISQGQMQRCQKEPLK